MTRALIFDCDGVLADTERHGHLVAFNRMWSELGVPWQWSADQYAEKLQIGGGKERLAALWEEPEFQQACPSELLRESANEVIQRWHLRKSEIYRNIVASRLIPPRPGIKRLASAALAAGWKLAVASTSQPSSVAAVLDGVVGGALASQFLVLAGDVVAAKKPAPDVYLLAAEELQVLPHHCVVIEDSHNGLTAAAAAGMACVVTPSDFTWNEDFSQARLVVSCLGDPTGPACQVLANRSRANPQSLLTVDDLERLLE
ncbi:MAG: HAD-IA family hydrolase [Planctomycetaceae bacterium]|nr:HAD-IA family hydrolase [Planctomycetaceae bacterium]